MEVKSKDKILELVPKKDSGELILGGILGIFGIVFLLAAPSVLHQEWSYRFGAISPGGRLAGAVLAIILGLFLLTGAGFNLWKKTLYRFDLRSGTFLFGEYLFSPNELRSCRITDIGGIILDRRLVSPGVERFWVGIALVSGEKVFFNEFFHDGAAAERVRGAIMAATGLKETKVDGGEPSPCAPPPA